MALQWRARVREGCDECVHVSIVPDTMKPSTALSLAAAGWADTLNYRLPELSQPHTNTHDVFLQGCGEMKT